MNINKAGLEAEIKRTLREMSMCKAIESQSFCLFKNCTYEIHVKVTKDEDNFICSAKSDKAGVPLCQI